MKLIDRLFTGAVVLSMIGVSLLYLSLAQPIQPSVDVALSRPPHGGPNPAMFWMGGRYSHR